MLLNTSNDAIKKLKECLIVFEKYIETLKYKYTQDKYAISLIIKYIICY